MNKFITTLLLSLILLSANLRASGDGEMALVAGVVPVSISWADKKMQEKGVYVFDANTLEEREKLGFIANSIHINSPQWIELLPKDKDATLIFYCLNRLCYSSSDATLKATKLGYKNSFVMIDGLEGWILSGRAVQKSNKQKISSGDWLNSKEVQDFTDSVHSELLFASLPSCRDCHGGKDGIKISLANDKFQVNNNCSTCHKDIKNDFKDSVHSQSMLSQIQKPTKHEKPNCSDCHSIHRVKDKGVLNFKQLSDKKCGSCHEDEQERYHETFHGKAMFLNSPGKAPSVAACYDCHGTHKILKIDNNLSTLSVQNRVNTCAKCHDNSNENFAMGFIAHADHTDGDKFPELYYAYIFMTGLVVVVFSFFGLHTLLWSIKLIRVRLANPVLWKAAKAKMHEDKVTYKRFSPLHMIQHFFVAASFLGLAFSGLPQKFYTAPWAQTMIDLMGGPISATIIHHISAIIMFICFATHCAEISYKAWKRRDLVRDASGKISFSKCLKALFGPESLMPRKQDFIDMKDNFKWFIGKGEKPKFDRWTYWEKFDYLAVFWGMFIIGFSGLVLWFPTFFASFLPGWFINLSTLVHSDEALLATGFIFAIHFFNTHFRADRFPMDMVIFSGVISQEEMKEDRPKWYERLAKEGRLDELNKQNRYFSSYKWLAKFVGFAMLFTGLVFLGLMLYVLYLYLLG